MISHSAAKEQTQRDSSVEPLVWLPDISVAIFPDKIIQYSKRKEKTLSAIDTTVLSIADIDPNDKVLSFSQNDIAFKIEEQARRIVIIKLKNEKVQLEFIVEKVSQLIIVQEVLRRKLCEIGFQQKFKMLKELGKGATAKVYLVERKSDGRLFAAKIISLKQSQNKEYETFINETKILKCLKNPNIVAIESLYISKKELISVLEYLEGGTLLDELKCDLIKSDRDKFRAVKDITQGLEHLRQKRIVHRDLKLENIMVRINKDKSKSYVLTDFGLACWIGQKQLLYEKCGTPGYIAPEILKASKGKVIVSHTADIFSLGVIFHFIFLLKAVFPYNGSPKQLLILNKKAHFSLQTKSHLSLTISQQDLLKRTLELDISKRASSRQLIDVYIKNFQKEVDSLEPRKRKPQLIREERPREQTSIIGSSKKTKIHLTSSIETIQKRPPSVDKNQFSNRLKTDKSENKPVEKRQGSVQKFINNMWSKISSSRSEVMKKKEESVDRKKQMKNFVH